MSLTMDTLFTKLEEASQTGDVNSLKELLKKDKDLLDKVIGVTLVEVRDNPLHIAAMLGHADFVREVIHHKPELAKELNGQGLSPLHLAAVHDHVTVVKELLKADLDLCLIREKQEGLLPLDIAVKNGRTVIIKELVEACEMIRAAGGKTAAEVLSESEPVVRDSNSRDSSNPRVRQHSTTNDIEKALPEVEKETEYDPQILLLVSTLVATVTFTAAILNPPGAFNSKGQPTLGDSLKRFKICNVLAFISSVSVMMLFLCVVPRKKKIVMKFLEMVIWVATFFMVMAFYYGMLALYDDKSDDQHVLLLSLIRACVILFMLGISWVVVRFLIFLLKKSGLWEPFQRLFGSLKRRLFFLKWQQLSKGSNCWKWFKRVICVVLILVVLVFYCFLLLLVILLLYDLKKFV
ncbi:uncharacterized protein LOC144574483 [Carex rostrata]